MTPLQFTIWLQGFLEAAGTYGLQKEQVSKIAETLNKVDYTPSYPVSSPSFTISTNDDKVPYSTICSCNQANGGSGICGCVMGNKMVPKNYHTKSNIYTTTADNIGFNWQFKDGKQILND
jgi:hypothetical protein